MNIFVENYFVDLNHGQNLENENLKKNITINITNFYQLRTQERVNWLSRLELF